MVKHPELYFDRTIRITASYELGFEGSNLNNVHCVRSHDDSIGVGFEPRDESTHETHQQGCQKDQVGQVRSPAARHRGGPVAQSVTPFVRLVSLPFRHYSL